MTQRKKCPQCGKRKAASQFGRSSSSKDGLQSYCSSCKAAHQLKWNHKNWGRRAALTAKGRAKRRNLEFDLDPGAIQTRFETGLCEATGIPYRINSGGVASWDSPSLDRINPSLGYTMNNVRIVLWAFNAACGTWGPHILMLIADSYRKHNDH